jgi:hyperosmotically inducible periplasmic protein
MKRLISLALMISLASTALATVRAGGKAATTNPPAAAPAQRNQIWLIGEVRHQLASLPYYGLFDWFDFEAKGDGTVILRGQVVRPSLKSEAENVVKRIEGVTNVVDEIEVLPLSLNDNRIRRQVYRALFNYNSPLFYYGQAVVPSIHIIVKNGRVTLKGVVDTQADSNYAGVMANGVSGVFDVKNELQIAQGGH